MEVHFCDSTIWIPLYYLDCTTRGLRYRNSQLPPPMNVGAIPPTWRTLPYVKNVSELMTHTFVSPIKQTGRVTLVNASEFEGLFVNTEIVGRGVPHPMLGLYQTGRQHSTRVKEHKGAVGRQDEISILALYCLTTGHAFDWNKPSVIKKLITKHARSFIETSTCFNQCVTLDPGNIALSDYWRRRRQAHSPSNC